MKNFLMKYFLTSLFIHLLIIGVLAYRSLSPPEPSTVIVEVYLSPSPSLETQQGKDGPTQQSHQLDVESKVKGIIDETIDPGKIKGLKNVSNHLNEKLVQEKERKLTEAHLKFQEDEKIISSYAKQLKIYLEKNKNYPRAALRLRQSGVVKVKLQIYKDGRFGDIQVISPSPFDSLNQAAVDLLKHLGSFKPLPS